MLLIFLLTNLLAEAYGTTQLNVRLGSEDFFLGEKFAITVSDVIYWLTGMCVGVIIAVTFLICSDFQAFKRRMDSLEEDEEESNSIGGSSRRGGRLIGPKKYPTRLEERMLSAIHTDPSNYFGDETVMKQLRAGKLIGSVGVPTGMEHLVLKDLSKEGENDFQEIPESSNNRKPRLIGPKKYATQMEDRFVRPIEADISNTFVTE